MPESDETQRIDGNGDGQVNDRDRRGNETLDSSHCFDCSDTIRQGKEAASPCLSLDVPHASCSHSPRLTHLL